MYAGVIVDGEGAQTDVNASCKGVARMHSFNGDVGCTRLTRQALGFGPACARAKCLQACY